MFIISNEGLIYIEDSHSESDIQTTQAIEVLKEFNKLIAAMNQPEPQPQITAHTYQFIPCQMI